MGMRILIMIIFFAFIGIINDIVRLWLQKRDAKKNNYDCKKCGVWDCPYRECVKNKG